VLKNQVRGNFVVLSKDDELTFEGDARSDISMYQNLNEYCDKSISKILLGQTGTTDEKSFSGSAGVHKEILDSIIRSDREFIESVVNSELVPKLQTLGLLPMNVYFGINENVNVDLTAQVAILKTLSDMGHKVTKDYIEETFDVELEEPIEVVTPNQDTQTQNNE
jgi:phage gp29-like protein